MADRPNFRIKQEVVRRPKNKNRKYLFVLLAIQLFYLADFYLFEFCSISYLQNNLLVEMVAEEN